MSLAHVMRQTRGVGDEERGHWLMSCLPNAPPLSLRGTFAPVRGKVVITPHWLERLGFATQVFGLRLSIPVEARGFAEDKHHERKPSEGVTPRFDPDQCAQRCDLRWWQRQTRAQISTP